MRFRDLLVPTVRAVHHGFSKGLADAVYGRLSGEFEVWFPGNCLATAGFHDDPLHEPHVLVAEAWKAVIIIRSNFYAI